MPKISVIMGVYNSDHNKLKDSIESILSQTFSDFEFIICDDGSTNDTYNFIKSYGEKDSRIKIIKNEKNSGLSVALNNCILNSTCEYLARMDDDDISLPNRLEIQYNFLLNNVDVDIVGSNVILFDEKGAFGKSNLKYEIDRKSFLKSSPICHPTIMLKKSAYIDSGMYSIEKKVERCEDYDFFAKAFYIGKKIFNIQEPLYEYREDMTSFRKRKKYKFRINEFKVRIRIYRRLRLIFPKGLFYCFKPLIIGLIPNSLYSKFKLKKHRRK